VTVVITRTLFFPLIMWAQIVALPVTGVAGIGNCQHVDAIGADAWYNWTTDTALECNNAWYTPMVRDAAQVVQLQEGLIEMQPGLSMPNEPPLLLSMNEPDKCPYQACISPLVEPEFEKWILDKYDTQHVSPAPSHENIQWLNQMRNAYRAQYGEYPSWDYLAAHCYFWDDNSLSQCKSIVRQYIAWSDAWDADGVLVTEFASFAFKYHPDHDYDYAPAVERGRNFIQWMNDQPEIKGYYWFSAKDWNVWEWYYTTALFDESDDLTPLGEMYRDEVR
jgi:hypothetical protein